MFEEETERESGASVSESPLPTTHKHDGGSLPLIFAVPPSPSERDQHTAVSSRHQLSGHRRRSGSVPCRRCRDQPRLIRSSEHVQRQTTMSVRDIPRIIVDQSQVEQTDTDRELDTGPGLRSKRADDDDSPTVCRPRCQTVSLHQTDRSPSIVLPIRRLSVSGNLSASRTVYTAEWVRLLLQRSDDASGRTRDDTSVSDPP